MKNLLLVFAILALPFGAAAQITISPANLSDESVIQESLVQASVNLFASGNRNAGFDQAMITCINPLGVMVWSRLCPNSSRFLGSTLSRTGKIISGGDYGDDALVTTFGQNGTIAWSKSFATSAVDRSYDVTTDQAGNIYFVGHIKTSGANSADIWAKLDPSGNVIWANRALRASGLHSARAVFYSGDSLFVLGQTNSNGFGLAGSSNRDISLTILNASTGAVLLHRIYGTHSNEVFLDAKVNQYGAFVLFQDPNSIEVRFVMKIKLSSPFAPEIDPVILQPNFSSGYGIDKDGGLILDGPDLYVIGGATGNSSQRSYILKLDQDSLKVKWTKLVTPGSSPLPAFGSAGVGLGGSVVFCDAQNGVNPSTKSVITTMTSSGVTNSCQALDTIWVESISYPVSSESWMLSFEPITLSSSDVIWNDYSPTVTVCGLGLLPITLLSFTGEKVDERVQLRWQTASEQNNEYFEVQRSLDREHWETIGVVAGAGNTSTANSYRLEDSEPFDGTNYYRLVQVDHDGTSTQSETVAVSFVREDAFVAYPNPVEPGTSFGIQGGEFETVRAFDLSGREVGLSSDGDKRFTLNAPSGVYLLSISRANGLLETLRVSIN